MAPPLPRRVPQPSAGYEHLRCGVPCVPCGMPPSSTLVGAPSYIDNSMRYYSWVLPGVQVGQVETPVPDGFLVIPSLKWTHTDSRGLEAGVTAAIARAKSRNWDDDGAVADLRALIIGGFALYDVLSGIVDVGTDKVMQIGVRGSQDFAGDPNRHELALCGPRALCAAASLAVKLQPSTGENLMTSAMTVDGGPATDMTIHPVGGGGTTVGFGWPAAVAVIVGIGAVVYLGERALEIHKLNVLRDDNIRTLMAIAASAVQVAKDHAEVEAKAGHPVPLNSAEAAIISSLNKSTETTAKANDITLQPAMPSIFPDTTKIVDKAIDTTGSVLKLGTVLAIGAAVVGAVLIVPKLVPALVPAHGGA